MSEVVNLRQARKRKERQLGEEEAAANRLRHGRSKSDRRLDAARSAKERRDLDRHLIKTEDER